MTARVFNMRDFVTIAENYKIEEAREIMPVSEERHYVHINAAYLGWISPEGKIYKADHHDQCAEEILNQKSSYAHECSGILIDSGYIRVAAYHDDFGANWETITPESASALADLISSLEEFQIYYLNSMTVLLKRQAIIAMRSLAKE